jgi:nucleotide-binding universal stress UspA family protein
MVCMAESHLPGPVLVGTDLSAGGDEAVRQADAWARRIGAPLSVVHGYPDPMEVSALFPQAIAYAMPEAQALELRAREAVGRRVVELTGRQPGEFALRVGPGSGHGLLLDEAERTVPALICVGGTGHGLVGRVLFGSTAEHVVRHARVSVLVARPAATTSRVVMVATDLSEPGLLAIVAAHAEAGRRNARLVAVHAITTAYPELASLEPSFASWDRDTVDAIRRYAATALESQLQSCGAVGEGRVLEGRPGSAVVEAARETGAELIVVGTRGRTGLARLALGSVAAAIVHKAECSVLVVRGAPA